ncbi:MAG: flagellar hook-length control protein FliK [Paracoccaceae bacterium]
MPIPIATITAVTQSEGSKAPSKSNANDGPAFEDVVRDLDADTNSNQDVVKSQTHGDGSEEVDSELSTASMVATQDEEAKSASLKLAEDPLEASIQLEDSEQTASSREASLLKADDAAKSASGSSTSPQFASVSERLLALQSSQAKSALNSQIEASENSSLESEHSILSTKQVKTNGEANNPLMSLLTSDSKALAAQNAMETALSNSSKAADLAKIGAKSAMESIELDPIDQASRATDAINVKEQSGPNTAQVTPTQSLFQKVATAERFSKTFNDQSPAEKYEMTWPAIRAQNTNTASNIVQAAMNSNPASTQAIAAAAANIQSDLKLNLTRFEKNEARELAFGSADGFETTSQHLRSVAQVAATRAELPPTLARQVAEALHRSPDKPIELTLSPAELGRVRMTLKGGENNMMVTVFAERPETLDLMRRNIEMLDQAMSDLGYENISFSFEQGGTNGSSGNNDETPNQGEPKSSSLDLDALSASEISDPPLQSLPINNGGLDVRL